MKLPIFDPLGILKEPAEGVLRSLGADVELSDPFREFALGVLEGIQGDEENEPDDVDPSKNMKAGYKSLDDPDEREAYLKFGKKAITFDCSRCQAIAERVASGYAPDSPKKQLECLYYIKMFDEHEMGTEGNDTAKHWLESKGLKDKLYAAYMAELNLEGGD